MCLKELLSIWARLTWPRIRSPCLSGHQQMEKTQIARATCCCKKPRYSSKLRVIISICKKSSKTKRRIRMVHLPSKEILHLKKLSRSSSHSLRMISSWANNQRNRKAVWNLRTSRLKIFKSRHPQLTRSSQSNLIIRSRTTSLKESRSSRVMMEMSHPRLSQKTCFNSWILRRNL